MKTTDTKKKKVVFVIVGPTAVGKTAYSIGLAKKVNGEIISADSRQVYKGLDIGSGKVTEKEMKGVPHYMLDVVSPKQTYTAHDFKAEAEKHIIDILARGKTPIIVGGTGFYIDALFGKWPLPNVPPNEALRKKLALQSNEKLFEVLRKLDPKRAKTIDQNNKVRLIRAIEIAKKLGAVPTVKTKSKKLPYDIVWMGIETDRESLRKKIVERLQKRLYLGMLDEVANLHKKGVSWKRLGELGLEYRYCTMYLQGKIGEAELIKTLVDKIYQYAMRQMTWFKSNKEISWIKMK
ncbi:MAG: tRNA delta(2)-isopentenylpyrophosphate transferase, tRNA dimethylallyltransferase [Candidatus Parcubacteria bacterium]|jgi:tRNA dimethylallyltransferase